MNPSRLPNTLRAILIALTAGVVLSFAAPAQAAPAVDGVIVDASWQDRRITVRAENGKIAYFIVPKKISIAGSKNVHEDALAFHSHLRPRTKVSVAQGKQLRKNVFAAADVRRR